MISRITSGELHPETSATISPFWMNRKSGQHP